MSDARTRGKAALTAALQPVLSHLSQLRPEGPATAAALDEAFPLDGPVLAEVRALVDQGLTEGWLCPREADGVRFGRVAKPAQPEAQGFSIDAVDMDGPGPGHTHPEGEFDLCFAVDGEPRFDGRAPGWTVYPPRSWHVPTVSGGRMAILYFLPEGAIRFEGQPA